MRKKVGLFQEGGLFGKQLGLNLERKGAFKEFGLIFRKVVFEGRAWFIILGKVLSLNSSLR